MPCSNLLPAKTCHAKILPLVGPPEGGRVLHSLPGRKRRVPLCSGRLLRLPAQAACVRTTIPPILSDVICVLVRWLRAVDVRRARTRSNVYAEQEIG
jgi:hypothetical protein